MTLLLLALLGHGFLWIGLVNRLHAVPLRRRRIKQLTLAMFAAAALIPIALGWRYFSTWDDLGWGLGRLSWPVIAYLALCWTVAAITLLRFVALRILQRRPAVVRFHQRRRAAIDPALTHGPGAARQHHFLTRLPRNEMLQLEESRWMLDVPRLTPALDGLTILHLSDFHFIGRVGKAYFCEVVRIANQMRPDLICITGDLVDRSRCFDWIAETLGRLSARCGVYYVLGNHDARVDVARLRQILQGHGLVDVGSRWLSMEINGSPVALAGDERPWFDDWSGSDAAPPGEALRIVLAHTPDRLGWARRQNADLMLAGHTHGGQIRIPPLGAIFAPTRSGVKHSSGVFFASPTILHVTRGVSSDVPMRWNCRPEVAWLRLCVNPVSARS
ncbi:MAG: metallophosphoesterase [Thermoguttaceae bacterium]